MTSSSLSQLHRSSSALSLRLVPDMTPEQIQSRVHTVLDSISAERRSLTQRRQEMEREWDQSKIPPLAREKFLRLEEFNLLEQDLARREREVLKFYREFHDELRTSPTLPSPTLPDALFVADATASSLPTPLPPPLKTTFDKMADSAPQSAISVGDVKSDPATPPFSPFLQYLLQKRTNQESEDQHQSVHGYEYPRKRSSEISEAAVSGTIGFETSPLLTINSSCCSGHA
jgi:hypothetical protein